MTLKKLIFGLSISTGLFLLAGCGGGSNNNAQMQSQNGTSIATPIQGSTTITCISDSGATTPLANAAAGGPLKALVPNAAGGYDTYSGTWGTGGTFTIANVPAGSYWLATTNLYLWTSSRNIDLGYRMWGGCQYEAPSRTGTSLQISASGLNPWQYYDYFSVFVPNARTAAGVPPKVGDTSTSWTIPNGNLLLLNAANGDNAYASQLVTAVYGGIEFHALGNFWGPQPITIQDGQANSLSATLQPLAQTQGFRANFKGSSFAAMYSNMFPGATEASPGYNVRLQVTPDTSAPTSNDVWLVETSHGFNSDVDAGDVRYANPFPSTWTTFLEYYDIVSRSLNVPGANSPLPISLFTDLKTKDLPTASNPVAPLVGPVMNPQINGASFFNDQTITRTTPTISWQIPSVGNASGYKIWIFEVAVTNGVASLQYQAILYTTSTSATLPPGILSAGKTYYIEIASLYRKNVDLSSTPYVETYPDAETHVSSGLITVQ